MISIAKAMKDVDLSKIAFIQYPTAYVEGGGAVEPSWQADAVNLALQQDVPVVLPTEQDSDFASAADPAAPVAEAPVEEAPAEEVPAEEAPAEAAPPAGETVLEGVSGQTAADVRCSAGRTLDDQ